MCYTFETYEHSLSGVHQNRTKISNKTNEEAAVSHSTDKSSIFTKPLFVFIGALICCALWGSAYPCIKIGYKLFDISSDSAASQIIFAGFRFTLAGIMTLIAGSFINKKVLLPKANAFGSIIILAFLQTVFQYVFFYIGLAHTTGVKSSLINPLSTFFAIFISALIFKLEKLTPRKLLGCFIGFLGVVIINLSGSGFSLDMHLNGEGFLFFSAISYAFSSVCLKIFSQKNDPLVLSGSQFIIGGLIMIAAGFGLGGGLGTITPVGIALLLYMAFISAAAYSLWGILLKYNPVSRITVFAFMNTVFGVFFSAILLGETEQALNIRSLIALVLVSGGILIVNRTGGSEASR